MEPHLSKAILAQPFSVLLPVYNEGRIIEPNTKQLYDYLRRIGFRRFEILICNNCSTDDTALIAEKLARHYPFIRHVYTHDKGIGAGIKAGIKASRFNDLILFPVDLAFHVDFIPQSLSLIHEGHYDILIGSKRHRHSTVKRHFSRTVATFLYNTLINSFFRLGIRDTQGTVTFKKSSIIPFFSNLTSDDAFFQTQFLVYSKLHKLKIMEIPVRVVDLRKSSFNLKSESFNLFRKLLREFFLVHLRR